MSRGSQGVLPAPLALMCAAPLLLCGRADARLTVPALGWQDATALHSALSMKPSANVQADEASNTNDDGLLLQASHCPGCPLSARCRRVWLRILVANESAAGKSCRSAKLHLEAARYYPLVPPYDVPPKPRIVFDSCAIVSNGGALLSSGCGAAIDSNDAVWRANSPQLAGYEADVGMRTTHRLINNREALRFAWNDSAFAGLSTMTTLSMLAPALSHHAHFTRKARSVPGVERVWQGTQAYREDLRRFWKARTHDNNSSKLKETSGMFMLAHAAAVCRVVNMFGFGAHAAGEDANGSSALLRLPYHFWDPSISEAEHRRSTLGQHHNFQLEHAIFRELASSSFGPGICIRKPPAESVVAEVRRMVLEQRKAALLKRSALAAQDKLLKASGRHRRSATPRGN